MRTQERENVFGQSQEPTEQPSFHLPGRTPFLNSPCRAEQKWRGRLGSAWPWEPVRPESEQQRCPSFCDFLHPLCTSVLSSMQWVHKHLPPEMPQWISLPWAYFGINKAYVAPFWNVRTQKRPQVFKLSAQGQGSAAQGIRKRVVLLRHFIFDLKPLSSFLVQALPGGMNMSILCLGAEERVCCVNTTKEGLAHKPALCLRSSPSQGSRERLPKVSEMMHQHAECKSLWQERRQTPQWPLTPLPGAPRHSSMIFYHTTPETFNCFWKLFFLLNFVYLV